MWISSRAELGESKRGRMHQSSVGFVVPKFLGFPCSSYEYSITVRRALIVGHSFWPSRVIWGSGHVDSYNPPHCWWNHFFKQQNCNFWRTSGFDRWYSSVFGFCFHLFMIAYGLMIWRFHSHGATPSYHPFLDGMFSLWTIQRFWGTPMTSWKPPSLESRISRTSSQSQGGSRLHPSQERRRRGARVQGSRRRSSKK